MNTQSFTNKFLAHSLVVGAVVGTSIAISAPAFAADFSFRGTFSTDDEVQLFNFTVGAPSTVTLRTYSYAGGTQSDGTVVPRGGFDPILALFDGAGNFIGQNDDGGPSLVPTDPVTSTAWDTFLSRILAPGNYTVSVMQYDNFANGPTLANGFSRQGAGNFRGGFIDVSGTVGAQRTSAWAFDILNVEQAEVIPSTPIPTPALLPGLVGLGVAALRKRKAAGAQVAEAERPAVFGG